ncbi:LRR_TYP [Nesidiocoris tenuis]|uniref:LRR_TYP n=1 Tax=Nesidiocoris tenuis TaxID=355587 RepID=A0ABN7ABA4_9HEMI|nr:LRR_TYP [Nesidiocoris tenuis]
MCLRPLLIVCWFCQTMSLCPTDCHCGLDARGRRQVICAKGGLDGAIPVNEMDTTTEVLKITAPLDNENSLTIGPIFHEFQKLTELQITYSNVPAIGKHSFWGVPSLKHLNLTNNNISQVLEYNFRGLVNLLELHLDYNRIESMGSGTFHHLPELRTLTLSHNRLKHLSPRLFLMLGKLRTLDLSFNDLEHLDPDVFKDVQDLRTFSCRSCALRKMNPHIYSLLSSLTHLDIGDNEFKYLDSHEFRDLRKLQVLHMDGNHFPVILEKTFSSQGRLRVLNLARNRIAKVTTHAFANLTSLVELDLSYNKLDKLEPTSVLPMAETLRSINIDSNNIDIAEFKYVLQIINKLKELSIAELGYTTQDIPLGLLAQLDSIKYLNMSGNELVHLPVQFLSPVPKLAEIDVSRNKFHGLDERLVVRLEKVKVRLDDNPWACDLCHITPMLSRVNESTWVKDAVCTLPYNLKGRRFETLTVSMLGWCGTGLGYREEGFAGLALTHNAQLGLIAAGAAVVLLVITIAAVVAGLLYNRHHAAYYYTNEERRLAEREKMYVEPEKKVSIATIDEITKDPELQVLAS